MWLRNGGRGGSPGIATKQLSGEIQKTKLVKAWEAILIANTAPDGATCKMRIRKDVLKGREDVGNERDERNKMGKNQLDITRSLTHLSRRKKIMVLLRIQEVEHGIECQRLCCRQWVRDMTALCKSYGLFWRELGRVEQVGRRGKQLGGHTPLQRAVGFWVRLERQGQSKVCF